MRARTAIFLLLVAAAALASWPARAAPGGPDRPPVVVWLTLTPAGDSPSAVPLHKPTPTDGKVYDRAQDLDATLRDAVQDLGYTLFVADAGPTAGHTRDEDLIERAGRSAGGLPREGAGGGTWVVSPRLESAGGGDFVVRLVAVAPGGRELRVRVETAPGDLVSVRGLVMLRDLLTPQAVAEADLEKAREEASRGTTAGVLTAPRSSGRAILAVNSGLFGAFTALSLQQASNSTDPRVLYPLLAVGTGIGVGAALLAADEWDVTSGDAWYLSAGALWGAASGLLIADAEDIQPTNVRYSWGVGGGLFGVALATVALTRTSMDDGDAILAHSGGALGLAIGAEVEYLDRGSTTQTPSAGMGYGAAVGLLGAGLLATRVTVSPSRVLLIDLGVGGGALIGASAASPVVFQNQNESNTRVWVSATLAGGLVGGGLAWWLTREGAPAPSAWRFGTPSAGIIGTSQTRSGSAPAYGASWNGRF